jgi:hypothetical protein
MHEDALATIEPDRDLYLAIPEQAMETIFVEEIVQMMMRNHIRRVLSFSI